MTFTCIGVALIIFALVGGLTSTEGSDGKRNWTMALAGFISLVVAVVKYFLF